MLHRIFKRLGYMQESMSANQVRGSRPESIRLNLDVLCNQYSLTPGLDSVTEAQNFPETNVSSTEQWIQQEVFAARRRLLPISLAALKLASHFSRSVVAITPPLRNPIDRLHRAAIERTNVKPSMASKYD